MIRFRQPVCRFISQCILLSCLPIMAHADLVSGKVTPVPSSKTFSIKNSQGTVVNNSVGTDADGSFEVTLRPGVYSAISDQGIATIKSSNRPLVGQVINFK